MSDHAYVIAERAKYQRNEWADVSALLESADALTSEQEYIDWLMQQPPFRGAGE